MNESKAGEIIDEREEPEKKEYPTERILNHRFNKEGQPEFHVLWKGFPLSQATWQSLPDVIDNKHFMDYYKTLPEKTRRNIRPPKGLPVGDDEDGLCFRRAVKKLNLPGVDVEQFEPWITLGEGIQKLRDQNCSVRKLRRRQPTKGRRLLTLDGRHMQSVYCKNNGYRKVTKKFCAVYVVTKLDAKGA